MASASDSSKPGTKLKQYSTFYVSGRLYGIDVMRVQEITPPLPMTVVPLAASYIRGLINLRGQIATAVGLRELFDLKDSTEATQMNVVCNAGGNLFSLLIDKVGDVMEVEENSFESPPETIPDSVRKYMSGVYKISGALLSILEIEKIAEKLNN
jgi:purine-binding chemotaxis protein CheW